MLCACSIGTIVMVPWSGVRLPLAAVPGALVPFCVCPQSNAGASLQISPCLHPGFAVSCLVYGGSVKRPASDGRKSHMLVIVRGVLPRTGS
jgi:hypothetical protein